MGTACRRTRWLPLGIGVGALGVTGQLALWTAIGVAFGAALQGSRRRRRAGIRCRDDAVA
jgi:hypothetical protein